jgi:putative transcriptional regulator
LTSVNNDIRQRRAELGVSQASLGEAVGVSRQTIIAIEAGRYLPSLPLAFGLAHYFDEPIEKLFTPDKGGLE